MGRTRLDPIDRLKVDVAYAQSVVLKLLSSPSPQKLSEEDVGPLNSEFLEFKHGPFFVC